ncbi:MAG TPA: hypothetical protein VHI13_05885 [Candidatus Kapabacteria bacterium]|nr:hypothetical protein [Candidatus Kapabacteria bacterium]
MFSRVIRVLLAGSFWLLALAVIARAQDIGITNGVPYPASHTDTTISQYLPSLPPEPAGSHGFLRNNGEGNWEFADGTPARFYGVSMQLAACFPDSEAAIVIAARLRKLGVNLVRFESMDLGYDWGDYAQQRSFLDAANGFRTLHAGQMARLDWFVYQLKQHGIYSYFILQSARAARADDGLGADADSAMWLGRELQFLYPKARAVEHSIVTQLMVHTNPHTGNAYRNEPALAMVEALDQGSFFSMCRLGYTEYRAGQSGFSYRHSRRVDTLFAQWLKQKYGSTPALAAAWHTAPPNGGYPSLITEGSFEGDFQTYWTINSYDGVTVSTILTQGDSVPNGTLSLKLRIKNAKGASSLYSAYMLQSVTGLEYNTVYRLSFKTKCANADSIPILLGAYQPVDGGMGAGLSGTVYAKPFWQQQQVDFLVPIKSTVPVAVVMWFGAVNGDLTFDDVQLRKLEVPGLVNGESLENFTVGRIPMGSVAISRAVSAQRVADQNAFYMDLERGVYDEMRRLLHDTIGARQVFTGAGHYWASGFQETMAQAASDFTLSAKGWDYISSGAPGAGWETRNTSPLRVDWGGMPNTWVQSAHRRQPFIASFQQPYPNRYQAESVLSNAVYSSLQDWDGLMWDAYADDRLTDNQAIDSLQYYMIGKNPLVTSLMPAASFLYRNRLVAPAQTTISIQHSQDQAQAFTRMINLWDDYGVPGGFNGRAALVNRIVIDSVNASYFTQREDISFSAEVDGQSESDTREILWEYSRGSLTLDAQKAQGVSGYLTRSGGLALRNLDIKLQSGNETATILWVPLDTAQRVGDHGRSLLTIASRMEPTGWHWLDTMHGTTWGGSPMLLDPVRVRLTIKPNDNSNVATLTPLDPSGNPAGTPITGTAVNGKIDLGIDQSTVHSIWFAVELKFDPSAAVAGGATAAGALAAEPSITSERSYVTYSLAVPSGDVRVEAFDALGRMVRTLHAGPADAGRHSERFDAVALPAGTYIIRLRTAEGAVMTTKVAVVR